MSATEALLVTGLVGVACLAAVRGFGQTLWCKATSQAGTVMSVGEAAEPGATSSDPCAEGAPASTGPGDAETAAQSPSPDSSVDAPPGLVCSGDKCAGPLADGSTGGGGEPPPPPAGGDDDVKRQIEATENAGFVVDVLPMFLPLPMPAKVVIGAGTKAYLVMIDRKKCDAAAACIQKLHTAIFENKANEHVDLWKMSNPNCTNEHLKAGWAKWQDAVKNSPELKELSEQVEKDGLKGAANKIQYTRYKCEHLKAVFAAVAKANGGSQTAAGNPACTQVQFPNLCELGAPKPVVPEDKLKRLCGIGAPHARLKHIAATGGSLCQYTCGAMAQGWSGWIQGSPAPKPVPKSETVRCEGTRCKASERDLVIDLGGITNSADCAHCCVQK